MPARKGDCWNESATWRDAWTLRACRRLTTLGEINQTPNYHTNIGFTADSEFLVFWTLRGSLGAFCKVEVATGEITQLTEPAADYGFCVHIQGGPYPRMCLAPHSRWLVYTGARSLKAVQLDTLEERTLIANTGAWELGYPGIPADEQQVILPLSPLHPEVAAGDARDPLLQGSLRGWAGDAAAPGERVVWRAAKFVTSGRKAGCRSFHAPFSPTDSDLLLLDRDFPPRYWSGSDGRSTRVWTLRLASGELVELAPRDASCFQTHCAWSFDGERVLYHGRNDAGGWTLGVCTPEGDVLREYVMPGARHYGHVSAMQGRAALLLDGNVSDNLLTWLYFDGELPRVEVIAAHNTQWNSLPGQTTHPHPLCSPDGRWISFNTTQKGRSDVAVVQV